jgi:hypothetical protein
MQRYHYFVHSAREHGSYISSVTESNIDESESDGVLANILVVLRRAHELFFDTVLPIYIATCNQILVEILIEYFVPVTNCICPQLH